MSALEGLRPDAIHIQTWRYPDTDESDEAIYAIGADEDVEEARLDAVGDAVRYMKTPPHRLTSKLVYHGPEREHEFEVKSSRTTTEKPE